MCEIDVDDDNDAAADDDDDDDDCERFLGKVWLKRTIGHVNVSCFFAAKLKKSPK